MRTTKEPQILLIGQVIVDVISSADSDAPKIRFGGIMHAARALWAIESSYGMAYVAPKYLDSQIQQYAKSIGACPILKIGSVKGSPNVLLIKEPKEYGPQGYEYLLRDELTVSYDFDNLIILMGSKKWTDVLIFPGGFDLESVLAIINKSQSRIYIDINFEPKDWKVLEHQSELLDTVIVSTSSQIFLKLMEGNVDRLVFNAQQSGARHLLFKENRGGSRFFNLKSSLDAIRIPAQVRHVIHSVGVGDCFDAVFVAMRYLYSDQEALSYASCLAAEYASTINPDVFKTAALAWKKVSASEVLGMKGISLGWEQRPNCQIYIAAPDFDYTDTHLIDGLVDSLKYHNFSPRLPVREHGQIRRNASLAEKQKVCEADLALLKKCCILIAVLLYNDPGTFIEIGIAIEKGIPVIVYDPYRYSKNIMLTELPQLVSSNLDEVIMTVFEEAQKRTEG